MRWLVLALVICALLAGWLMRDILTALGSRSVPVAQSVSRETRLAEVRPAAGPNPIPKAPDPSVRWVSSIDTDSPKLSVLDESAHVLERDPFNEAALRDALAAAREVGAVADIAECCRRLAVLHPADESLVIERAAALVQLDRYSEAIQVVGAAADRLDSATVWLGLARTLRTAGRLSEADAALERAQSKRPGDVAIQAERGAVLVDLQQYRAALTQLEPLANAPEIANSVESQMMLALAYSGERRFPDARRVLAAARLLAPRDIRVINALADICWREYLLGLRAAAKSEAVELWQRSLELAPGQEEIAERLGRVDPASAQPAAPSPANLGADDS